MSSGTMHYNKIAQRAKEISQQIPNKFEWGYVLSGAELIILNGNGTLLTLIT